MLSGKVYVQFKTGEINQDLIRKSCRRIIRKTLSQARKQTARTKGSRYLPLAFAQINVLKRDYRRRCLESYGLGSDLIGTIRIQRISRNKSPDIMGSTIEQKGRYRIAWNKAWLEDVINHQ